MNEEMVSSELAADPTTDNWVAFNRFRLNRWIVFIGMLLILAFVYSSVYQRDYLVIDDYFFLNYFYNNPHDYVDETSVQQGRFLCSILTTRAIYRLMAVVESGKIFRFCNILILACVGLFFYHLLRISRLGAAASCLIAISICTLIPFQVIPFWACTTGSGIGLLCSLGAGSLFFSRIFSHRSLSNFQFFKILALVALLFILSLWLYESFAMSYWTTPALIVLLAPTASGSWRRTRKILLLYSTVAFFVLGLQFCLLKLVPVVLDLPLHQRTTMVASIADVLNRMKWFVTECLSRGFCFWSFKSTPVAAGMMLIVVVAAILRFGRALRETPQHQGRCLWVLVERGMWVVVFILLAFLPSLLVRESLTRYRTFIPFVPILFLSFVLSIREIIKLIYLYQPEKGESLWLKFLFVVLVFSCFVASDRVSEIVYNNSLDRQVLLSELRQYPKEKFETLNKLYVIPFNDPFSNRFKRLEFAYLTSSVPWAVESMTRVLLSHEGIDTKGIEVKPIRRPPEEANDASTVEIDMRKLRRYFDADSGFLERE